MESLLTRFSFTYIWNHYLHDSVTYFVTYFVMIRCNVSFYISRWDWGSYRSVDFPCVIWTRKYLCFILNRTLPRIYNKNLSSNSLTTYWPSSNNTVKQFNFIRIWSSIFCLINKFNILFLNVPTGLPFWVCLCISRRKMYLKTGELSWSVIGCFFWVCLCIICSIITHSTEQR